MTTSAVDEFEQVVASEDMYTKTHGHQLLVNNLYAEEKTAIHANSFLHGLKYLYNAILQHVIKGNYFTAKVSRLPTIPRKPRSFSTSNNLQYTVLSLVTQILINVL